MNRQERRTLILVIVSVFLTVAIIGLFNELRSSGAQTESLTTQVDSSIVSDSIILADGSKVNLVKALVRFSPEEWFSDFSSNQVSFNQSHDNKRIDVIGRINKISDNSGCSTIYMESDNSNGRLTFSNCSQNQDKWRDKIASLEIGQNVHISGYYSANLSTDYEMHLYRCELR